MMRGGRTIVFVMAIAAMLVLSGGIQAARDRAFPQNTADAEVLYVRSSDIMQRAALSYRAVVADAYWIRALQHYGRERLKAPEDRRYDQLYPLLDIATTLDPRFVTGYRFGAIFLSEPHPGGAGRPDLAIALLKKGIARNPEKWDYYHDVGFIYYWSLRNYEEAAAWFTRGSERQGAPWWLKTYAAVMLTRGGDRQSSRVMWEQIGRSEDNDWLRRTAQTRLAQLDALDQIDGLERIVQDFARAYSRPPRSWQEMIAARLLPGIPADPTGTPYVLVAATGEVTVAASSRLHPLPTDPKAAPELNMDAGR